MALPLLAISLKTNALQVVDVPGLTHRTSVFLPGPSCEHQSRFVSPVPQLESSNYRPFRDFPNDSGVVEEIPIYSIRNIDKWTFAEQGQEPLR